MTIEEHIPLSTLTTFHMGGNARFVCTCTSREDVRSAVAYAKEHNLPWYVLGEGSNVLASDNGFDGVIIRIAIPDISFTENEVTAGAGVSWDMLVAEVAARGLWGMENLAGIPGTVGAAPVQNIGAYGAELKDIFVSAEVLDTTTDTVISMRTDECAFSYRDSVFKHDPSRIILSVTFQTSTEPAPRLGYRDLEQAQERGVDLSTPQAIGTAVRAIRKEKFPDLSEYGTAGSFFKNPILSEETYNELVAQYGEIPQFPNPHGIKIPLAFILDKVLGLRGYRDGAAWLFGAQPLVVVVDRDGTSADVERLASFIETTVKEKTGISIEREVRTLQEK